MKICSHCHQLVAEDIRSCPSCGQDIRQGRQSIDEYHIKKVLHEGYSSILCQTVNENNGQQYMVRIFSRQPGVDDRIASRLMSELQKLQQLPEAYFVVHHSIRRSSDGFWYRVSEWIDADKWPYLLASGQLRNFSTLVDLFYNIACILQKLHEIGHTMPHLILDDIIVFKDKKQRLRPKIDFKISRFLDPQLTRPGPMLKKLLETHPDIRNQRPVDIRSDIWSLGKIFIELLCADPDLTNYRDKIDEFILPHEMETLLKLMLSDDPDLRPQSMGEVTQSLERVKQRKLDRPLRKKRVKRGPWIELIGLRQRISVLAVAIVLLTLLGGAAVYFLASRKQDSTTILATYAERYARSVAFVVSEYWLTDGKSTLYRNRTEGTAFLVDAQGYLLTNRHVACPWLEDAQLYGLINGLRQYNFPISLEYKVYLWFEGAKAFKRLSVLMDSPYIEDIYGVETAYSTESDHGLKVVGVGRPPTNTYQQIKSPLQNDFAVLKIETVPQDLMPLPLDTELDPKKIPRLEPIITLGFPLGSRAQETFVNVSVTRGHVRRNFENVLQVDTSIYKGNSGGPVIDTRGKVIGIASRVAVDFSEGQLKVPTLLSDIGMVLPITKAAGFIRDLKVGKIKWDGALDLYEEDKIKKIILLARERRWYKAAEQVDQELATSTSPTLVMAGAMVNFCARKYDRARQLFEQTLSMDESNGTAQFMLYLIDWVMGNVPNSVHHKALQTMNWRSYWEFYGHLLYILEGDVTAAYALQGGYTNDERGWLHYLVGTMRLKHGLLEDAETLMQKAVTLADGDGWLFYLALAQLDQTEKQQLENLRSSKKKKQYAKQIADFFETVKKKFAEADEAHQKDLLAPPTVTSTDKADTEKTVYQALLDDEPDNGEVLHDLAFLCAMEENWDDALKYITHFLEISGRQNALRMTLALWEPLILNYIGQKDEAKSKLEAFFSQFKDPWFTDVGKSLLNPEKEKHLLTRISENPEYMLTGYTALGFWAEGQGDHEKALHYYREALATYKDDWRLFEFAWSRIKKIREKTE